MPIHDFAELLRRQRTGFISEAPCECESCVADRAQAEEDTGPSTPFRTPLTLEEAVLAHEAAQNATTTAQGAYEDADINEQRAFRAAEDYRERLLYPRRPSAQEYIEGRRLDALWAATQRVATEARAEVRKAERTEATATLWVRLYTARAEHTSFTLRCGGCYDHVISSGDIDVTHPLAGGVIRNGKFYCLRNTFACSDCGAIEVLGFGAMVARSEGFPRVCETCRDISYALCDCCGEWRVRGDVTPWRDNHGSVWCTSCQENAAEQARESASEVGDYHSCRSLIVPVPSPWTAVHSRRYFGVELETEYYSSDTEDGTPERYVRKILKHVNEEQAEGVTEGRSQGPLLFAEHDGSLYNGAELITQPMGLDDHIRLWKNLLVDNRALFSKLRSHDTETCGIHVHVSKEGLSAFIIAKAVCFVNDPQNIGLVETVARRGDNGFTRKEKKKLSQAAYADRSDRYQAVNLLNEKTIEFRIFRGSLEYDSVVSAVEFCNAVVEFAAITSGADLTTFSFLRFIHEPKMCADTKHLRPYLARRSKDLALHIIPEKATPTRTTPSKKRRNTIKSLATLGV